jgi:hypothetical protein
MSNQAFTPQYNYLGCAAAAARQGEPADGTAVLSNMFVKALHQQGGIARPNSIIYIRGNLSLYFSMLAKQYSHLIGNIDQKLPN